MAIDTEELFTLLTHFAPIPKDPRPFVLYIIGMLPVLVGIQLQKSSRLAVLPLMAAPLYASLLDAPTAFHGFSWCYNWGLFMVIVFLYMTHKLFIDPQVPAAPKSSLTEPSSWLRAYKEMSERAATPTGPRQSRLNFLLHRGGATLAVGATLCVMPYLLFPGPFMPLAPEEFDPAHQTYLRRLFFPTDTPVTIRETAMRAVFAAFAGGEVALQLSQCHNILSLIAVCVLFVDRPEDWPTFFRPVTEITSLRAFWGRFWHRVIVRTYAGLAGVFSSKALGLTPRSNADRFVVHALVFAISGAVHAIVSWAFGQQCGLWRDFAWYAATYPAIVLEAGVVAAAGWTASGLARTLGAAKDGSAEKRAVNTTQVAFGLAYLFFWFFWSVPKLYYPKAYCLPEAFE